MSQTSKFPDTLSDPAYAISVEKDGQILAVFQFTEARTLKRSTYLMEDIPDMMATVMLLEIAAMQLKNTVSIQIGILSDEIKRLAQKVSELHE